MRMVIGYNDRAHLILLYRRDDGDDYGALTMCKMFAPSAHIMYYVMYTPNR